MLSVYYYSYSIHIWPNNAANYSVFSRVVKFTIQYSPSDQFLVLS